MKYEGPQSYQSKDMASVIVFTNKQTDRRTNRQAKNYIITDNHIILNLSSSFSKKKKKKN